MWHSRALCSNSGSGVISMWVMIKHLGNCRWVLGGNSQLRPCLSMLAAYLGHWYLCKDNRELQLPVHLFSSQTVDHKESVLWKSCQSESFSHVKVCLSSLPTLLPMCLLNKMLNSDHFLAPSLPALPNYLYPLFKKVEMVWFIHLLDTQLSQLEIEKHCWTRGQVHIQCLW